MKYIKFIRTGLDVSRTCFGYMTWGSASSTHVLEEPYVSHAVSGF
jgi:aryl-alcohol dehydrogenase-like predicted oxidoreductase